MSKLKSDSDFTQSQAVDYGTGFGYYTTHSDVTALLQCQTFTGATSPTNVEVGKIIKRVEGKIDDSIKTSFRPEIIEKEHHDFIATRDVMYPVSHWKDYVGFVQLIYTNIRKMVRLEVWKGDQYEDIASAMATLTPTTTTENHKYIFYVGTPGAANTIRFNVPRNVANGFYNHLGPKTTVLQICDAINEKFPTKTAGFTGETQPKTIAGENDTGDGGGNHTGKNISDFFYASPSHDGTKVKISSLLPSDAGTICTIEEWQGSTLAKISTISFEDKESFGRREDWWDIKEEGRIYFRRNWPYIQNNAIKVTYQIGGSRVPSAIHEAATKMVAAEVLLHDDNTVLIAETGANIDLKTKHDILVEEAKEIIDGKKQLLHLID